MVFRDVSSDGSVRLTGGPAPVQEPPTFPEAQQIEVSFTSPSATWTLNHGFGTDLIEVRTFDTEGDEIFGDVTYPTLNQAVISWYYPIAGSVWASTY